MSTPQVAQKIAHWFATGETGVSSKTMALYLGFREVLQWHSHPHDPADLDRCLRLLDDVPELRDGLTRMGDLSPEWRALVARWDEVEQCHLNEVGLGWSKARSAPTTYKLMREIIEGASA